VEGKKNVKGLKIRTLNYIMILIACILYIFVLYETVNTTQKYQRLAAATEDYIFCEEAAAMVNEGSDVLTEQARLYVVTARKTYADAYFEEADVTKQRENGLNALIQYDYDEDANYYLDRALQHSNDLMEREIYAMKLVSVANRYDLSQFSQEIQDYQLTAEDKALTAEEQLEKAEGLMFDSAYQDAKALIETDIAFSIRSILSATRGAQEGSMETLGSQIRRLRIYISILFLMNILIFFFITILIIKPLQIYIKCIHDNRTLEVMGAYEFKYLALTYNDIYELKSANEVMLRQKAERDALTGIFNRGAFDQLCNSLKANPAPVTMLLIDVDNFKSINDQYGHTTGDRILKKVADLLANRFRATDYVCRIGGDEFAVVIPNANDEINTVILEKITDMNRFLQDPKDGLPPVSLSVGGAFSSTGYQEDLYKKADKALYRIKEHGRGDACFYQEGM